MNRAAAGGQRTNGTIMLVAPYKNDSEGLAQFPPIGLGYLASALRRAGFTGVSILDCVLEGVDLDGFVSRVEKERPYVLGINSWSVSVREVAESLAAVKALRPAPVTVLGGPHPSAMGPRILTDFPGADYAFLGEGEVGLPLLVERLLNNTGPELKDIPGLIYRTKDGVKANERSLEQDLDRLGIPSWDLIRPERYASAGTLIQKRTACIITTRGCPFPCTFCSASITAGKTVRRRSIGHILTEIRLLADSFGIKRFVVFDENITLNHEHIKNFCNAMIDEGKGYSFELPNGIRLDTLTAEVLGLMRRAGFSERVAVGIESGSERMLKFMKKGLTKAEIKEKVALLKSAGFKPVGYFILGYPTETPEEINQTVDFAIELKLYRAGFMPYHPLPGTESFDYLVEHNELPEGFDFSVLATDSIAYAPKGMTKSELERIRKRAILRFNLRPRVVWDYVRDYNSLSFMARKLKSVFLKNRQGARKPALVKPYEEARLS